MPHRRRFMKSKGSKGAQALRKVEKLERAVGKPEYKFLRTAISATPEAAAGEVLAMTAISQGDTTSSREGNVVQLKFIEIGGSTLINASSTITGVRMMLVRDNSRDASIPTWTSLFPDAATAASFAPRSASLFRNSKYTVLWDHKFIMEITQGGNNSPIQIYHFYKSLNHKLTFSGTAGTDEGPGMIYLFVLSDEATNSPLIDGDCIVRYTDV